MTYIKTLSGSLFRAVTFNEDTATLMLLSQDDIVQRFKNVDQQTFISFPTGETGNLFYLKSIRGLFPTEVLSLNAWEGEPVHVDRKNLSRSITHAKYNQLAFLLTVCRELDGTATSYIGVTWRLAQEFFESTNPSKYLQDKIHGSFEDHPVTCSACVPRLTMAAVHTVESPGPGEVGIVKTRPPKKGELL